VAVPRPVGVAVELGEFERLILALGTRSRDVSRWFRFVLDPDLSARIRRQFETRGRALGSPWARLSPTTIELRGVRRKGLLVPKPGRARAGLATPMRDTNRLYAAWTKAQGPESIRVIGPTSYERGVTVPYAAAQAYGIARGRHQMFGRPGGGVPARPVLPKNFPRPVLAAWEGSLARYLETGELRPVGSR
jgi:hypothetical protein